MHLIALVHTVRYSTCSLRTVCKVLLSAMRTKAVQEIEISSSDFRICYSPKHQFITFPQLLRCVSHLIPGTLCSSTTLTFYPVHSFFWLSALSFSWTVFILSAFFFFSCPLRSELSLGVTCTCQSCIVWIQHIPLAKAGLVHMIALFTDRWREGA